MAKALLTLHRLALFVALTVALVATGMAHRLPNAQDEAVAFALAIGADASDFCGDTPGASHPAPDCLACQISGGADLPPVTGAFALLPRVATAGLAAPHLNPALPPTRDPSHPPQGPPVA